MHPLEPLTAAEVKQTVAILTQNGKVNPTTRFVSYQVRWQKWSFVIGFNAREGLTLHHLRYNDEGEDRSILYRASLTEMVVPYGDPGPTQRRKNAFDVGEYGMGMCANSLELGCDCLGLIRYFDAHLCNSRGEALTIKNAVCMHEEDFGILWKHTDRRLNTPEVRRSRRLVMPTAYIGFLLKPNGFFRQNPANDVPPSQKKTVTKNCCH